MAMFLLYLHAVAGCGWLLLTVMRWKMLPNWLHWVKFYHEPHRRRNSREGGGMNGIWEKLETTVVILRKQFWAY